MVIRRRCDEYLVLLRIDKWDGTKWATVNSEYVQKNTSVTKSLTDSNAFYAWQVAAVDTAAVNPATNDWYSWATDWNRLHIGNPATPTPPPTGGPTQTANPTQTPIPTNTGPTPTPCASCHNYYIAPPPAGIGNNNNNGTSASTPWSTFAYAIPRLMPGDTLYLLDGTYTKTSTGLPSINCSSGAKSGTSDSARITIKAQNERKAWLKADGSTAAFWMQNCNYWNIQGLHGSSADLPAASGGGQVAIFDVEYSNYINMRRLLADHTNRCFNTHAILVGGPQKAYVSVQSSHILIEDTEVYYYHRYPIIPFGAQYVTMRRTYTNSRNYPASTDPACNNTAEGQLPDLLHGGADGGPTSYGGINILMEDGITENDQSSGCGLMGQDSKIYGCIALSVGTGVVSTTAGGALRPSEYHDFIAVNSGDGIWPRGGWWTTVFNATLYNDNGSKGGGGYGLRADTFCDSYGTICTPTDIKGIFGTNILTFNNKSGGTLLQWPTGTAWLLDYTNSANNGGSNFNPSEPNISDASGFIQHSMSVVPTNMGLGTNQCIVYVPGGHNGYNSTPNPCIGGNCTTTGKSNMAGIGKNGADIGANLVYQHTGEAGGAITLSPVKLWNQSTGVFSGCGATVAGLNDDPNGTTVSTQSCINVHKRLNVGVNGCPIP